MKKILILFILLVLFYGLKAQIITTEPAIPTAGAPVKIIFNATGTALAGYTGDVYAHTGVTIEGLGRWKNVIGTWGVNTSQPKLTRVSTNLYELNITPSINTFYSVTAGQKVTEMCFVFRSSDKTKQTADLFVTVYELGLAVSITSPTTQPYFVDASSSFDIQIATTLATSVLVKIDGETVHTETSNPASFSYTINTGTSGTHEIVAEAHYETDIKTDNFIYTVKTSSEIEALPVGMKDGINYIDENTVTLVLHAPYKNTVHVFGSFNEWQPVPLKRTHADANNLETRYWTTINNLTAGQEYLFQYIVDYTLKIADPYADKISDPWNDKYINEKRTIYPDLIPYPEDKTEGVVSSFQTAQTGYTWKTSTFTAPKVEDLVIYELLIRDFTANADYQTMIDTLKYFKRLGINAIELMPINEFEGNNSWGYNPAFYFAPDKAYGTKNKLKEFIDSCHNNGIAVIIDMVLNHSFGLSPFVQLYFDKNTNKPTAQNIWYNQTSPNPVYSWGYDFNHQSTYTQQLVDRVNSYWLSEYKVDGFRFDFTKGFTNTAGDGWAYDAQRIGILKRMYDEIKEVNPNAYVILEHLADNSEEIELSDYGMLLWGNMNGKYCEGAMGYNEDSKSDFSGISYQQRNWNNPHLVGYMESHDEERMMYRNLTYGNSSGQYNVKTLKTALSRVEMAAAFFLLVPGPKMIWQFGELGYDYSINYPGTDQNPKRTDPKPVKWEYYGDNDRFRLFQVFSYLINLKKNHDVFETTDFNVFVTSAVKRINLSGTDMNVTIIGNFGVTSGQSIPGFQHTGTWYDYFSGAAISVTNVNDIIPLAPGEFHIYTDVQLQTPVILLDVKEITAGKKLLEMNVYPNPASDRTKISFYLDENVKDADVSVYDIQGKKITTIHQGSMLRGEQEFVWNLNSGSKVAGGAYLLKVNAGQRIGQSVILVK